MLPVPSPELGHVLTLIVLAAASFLVANLMARAAGYKE